MIQLLKNELFSIEENADDTASIASILNGYTIHTLPAVKFDPSILFSFAIPAWQDSAYENWDSLSADDVAMHVFKCDASSDLITSYARVLDSLNVNQLSLENLVSKPVWMLSLYPDRRFMRSTNEVVCAPAAACGCGDKSVPGDAQSTKCETNTKVNCSIPGLGGGCIGTCRLQVRSMDTL